MSTSPEGGAVLFDAAQFDADSPFDTALYRNALLGTLLHKADELAQHHANWVAPDASLSDEPQTHLEPGVTAMEVASSGAPAWYAYSLRALCAVAVNADGTGYPLRVGVAGRSSNGGRVDFGVVVAPAITRAEVASWGSSSSWGVKTYSNITSTTAAWLTSDDASNMITLPKDLIDAAVAAYPAWPTLTDIGGDGITRRIAIVEVAPVAQTWSGTAVPELHGFHASAYIGA